MFGDAGAPIILVDRDQQRPIQKLQVCAADVRELNVSDVKFKVGPGANKFTKRAMAYLDDDTIIDAE